MNRLTSLKLRWGVMVVASMFLQFSIPAGYNAGLLLILLMIPVFIFDISVVFYERLTNYLSIIFDDYFKLNEQNGSYTKD